jgi:hypothetical protein
VPVSASEKALLARHVPELRYHVLECYRADSAATITDNFVRGHYSNELRSPDQARPIARAAPTPRAARLSLDILAPAGEAYFPGGPLAQADDYLDAHDKTLAADARRLHALPHYADVAYCRIAPGTGGRRWLQYWFFYYHNPYGIRFFGAHESDWEMIQIAVDANDRPLCVTYAQHERGERRDWDEVTVVDGGRPVVYVAKGSHAAYFRAGTLKRPDVPGFVRPVLKDHTSDGEAPVRPRPYYLDLTVDRWLKWPGSWGASRKNLFSDSPAGPLTQAEKWERPEDFHANARDGAAVEQAALALEALPSPPVPAIDPRVDGDALRIAYAFPAVAPGTSDPVRIEIAIHGASGTPTVGAYDVADLAGEVRQPLPPAPGPYRIQLGAYDDDDAETLAPPIAVPAVVPPPLSGASASIALATPVVSAAPLRVLAEAPAGEPDAGGTLVRTLADLAGGPWSVAPLFAPFDPVREPELSRHWSVAGSLPTLAGLDPPGAAFELARQLAAALGDGWHVDADVTSSVAVTDPESAADALSAEQLPPLTWALEACRLPAAWAHSQGEGIVVGHPDTGYTDHPELVGAIDTLRGYDVLDGDPDAHSVLEGFPPFAFPSHGTGTASVIASRTAGRITGAAPCAMVVPIRAARTVVHFRNASLALAVDRARRVGCHVISISMGGLLYPRALRAAIRRCVDDGILVLAAAGQPLPVVVAPASYPECLGVGGTTFESRPWLLSARGAGVDVSAPALNVWVAATSNEPGPDRFHIAAHDGTSFSVALTAGAAALWLAHHGRDALLERFGREQLQGAFRSLLQASATVPSGWDAQAHGAGIVNAEALLDADLATASLDSAPPSPPLSGTAAWVRTVAAALAPEQPDAAERVAAALGHDEVALAAHGDELVFRLAEEPEVRVEVLGSPGTGAALDAVEAPALPQLAAVASPGLRAALR